MPTTDVPPRESVWTKYSPNHEFEIAATSSIVLHGVVFLAFFLAAGLILWNALGDTSAPSPKMDVALVADPTGDGRAPGGGSPTGPAGSPTEQVQKDVVKKPNLDFDAARIPEALAPLTPFEFRPDIPVIAPDVPKQIDLSKAFERIEHNLKLPKDPAGTGSGMPGKGNGGGGQGGGGYGPGKGPGVGPGDGIGGPAGNATQAEIYARRWRFNLAGTPREHVQKLLAAGVVVGFKDGNDLFWLITDLKNRPVQFRLEPFAKYENSVKWKSENPHSVLSLSQELRMPGPPACFILLLPKDREQRLANLEAQFARERNRDLSQVTETWFDFRQVGGAFEPAVVGQVPFEPRPKW